jgi:subfamily B ATP-binding cassette protein MsbA
VLAAATGLYAYLMGPALRFLLSGGSKGLGPVVRYLPALAQLDRSRLVWLFPGLIVAVGAIKGIAYLGQFFGMGLFGHRLVATLRRALFERFLALSPIAQSDVWVGDLLSRLSSDVAAVETAAIYAVGSYVKDGLQVAVLLAVAVAMSPMLAVAALVIIPLAAFPVSRLTRAFLARVREGQSRLGTLSAQLHEGLGGLRTLQAFNAETLEKERFARELERQRRAVVRSGWLRGAVPGMMELFAASVLAGALALTARYQLVPPENLISLLAALLFLYQPIKDLGRVTQFAHQAAVAGERIFEVLDRKEQVVEAADARTLPRLSEEIAFEDVGFSYGDRPALEGLSFALRKGERIALVGPSGGGKSTVTRLLLGFARPGTGRILLDGVDAREGTLGSLRTQFALVTQDALLFDGTVRENLLVGNPTATEEALVQAARIAQADGFVRALPKGYDTPLGERGVALSGGQRQRLCLARALLADAPVLVLDEATSNLDPESEREVQQALDAVLPGQTALIVAHRLATVAAADRIYVLEAGQVTERGTHAELLARGGTYSRMWNLQHGHKEVA